MDWSFSALNAVNRLCAGVRARGFSLLLWGLALAALIGCTPKPPQGPPLQAPPFVRLSAEEIPTFKDDLDPESLRVAIKQSLTFFSRIPGDRTFALGDLQVRADTLKATLTLFLELADSGRLDAKSIASNFDVYGVNESANEVRQLVTGYFEPILNGRLDSDKEFLYPLYGIPPDLVTIDLSAFDPARFSGERLVGRVQDGRIVPYYSRVEIDGQKKLASSGCRLVWLKDPIDAFFLQVQGSGMIRLADGKYRRLGYAGSNGRAYRSIGKYLIDKGLMSAEDMSLQNLRAFLKAHPGLQEEVLAYNESYVFFKWVEDGPMGSLNVPLTGGRSIATDPKYHPRGALAFLASEKPRLGPQGQVVGWEPLGRWVLNQDVGGAIKGVGRVDLFCGTGDGAESMAGPMKQPGKLYFLLKKGEAAK